MSGTGSSAGAGGSGGELGAGGELFDVRSSKRIAAFMIRSSINVSYIHTRRKKKKSVHGTNP